MLDKPAGMTSHDVVMVSRRLFGTAKSGHAGTLDPSATGLLVLCLGRATRLLEYLTGCDKDYVGEMVLGAETDSDDADGEVVATRDASHLVAADVEDVLPRFLGEIDQVPPMASAKKVAGQRLYRLYRRGEVIEREAVPVVVHELALTGFEPGALAVASVAVRCGPGTYIRALARDIGDMLGVGGHLRSLRRTRVGSFSLGEAVTLAQVEALAPDARRALLHSPVRATAHLAQVRLRPDARLRLTQGKVLKPGNLLDELPEDAPSVAVLSPDGEDLWGIAVPRDGMLQPRKVLAVGADTED